VIWFEEKDKTKLIAAITLICITTFELNELFKPILAKNISVKSKRQFLLLK